MTYDAVARIERGRANPDLATLVHLADACEVRLAAILELVGL